MAVYRPPSVSRIDQMQTYAIKQPVGTHFRLASCAELAEPCAHHVNGWDSIIDETTVLGMEQAGYIRRHCTRIKTGAPPAVPDRRRYTESQRRSEVGGVVTVFHFPAGQQCFAEHRVPLERPAIFLRRDGDFRGDPAPHRRIVHTRAEHWVEDFAGHQQRLADLQQKG